MTVVNFLCRREKLMMKAKIIIAGALIAISYLLIIPLSNQAAQKPLIPEVRSVSASLEGKDNISPTENKAIVGEETAEISLHSPPPSETDFEPLNSDDSTEILAESSVPRDNATPTHELSKNTAVAPVQEPQMGDTRTVNGQKQVYFLGVGWIEENDEPNQGFYAEDMYENGNKIGSMGGGTLVDGDGDINKMVGCMD